MPTGTIKKIVHLSQATYLPNARLVPGHNEKGYGIIDGVGGVEVYFPHETVTGHEGFNELRKGLAVEYTVEAAPYQHMAKGVRLLALSTLPNALPPAGNQE